MRPATRVRMFPGAVAGLALAIGGGGHALTVSDASVSPGLQVPLGTVVTITATLTNDSGFLGALCAETLVSTAGCGYCSGTDGAYAVYADDPLILSGADAVTPTLSFSHASMETAVVVWRFTATRTGTTGLSLWAIDHTLTRNEGCADPSPGAACSPYTPMPTDVLTCGFVSVTVTSTLTGRSNASVLAPTARPANTAYPDDTIAVVMSVTNTGATPLNLQGGWTRTRAGSVGLVTPAGAPVFPIGVPAGSAAFLTWTFSVTATSPTGVMVRFDSEVEGTLAVSNALTIGAAPLSVAATLLVDPDGAAPGWSTIYAASSYVLINDEIHVVASVVNLGSGSIDVDPEVIVPDAYGNGMADAVATAARTPAGVQVLGGFTSRMFTWKYRVNRNDDYQSCWFGGPPPMNFVVRARGVTASRQIEMQSGGVSLAGDAPTTVTIGSPFSATLWVTNQTGRAIELDASATVFLVSDDPAKATLAGGPVPAGSRVFAPGESLPYVFSFTPIALGSVPLRGGILFPYAATPAGPCYSTPSSSYVEIGVPSPLDIAVTPSATLVNIQTPYLLTVTVSNGTTCPATLDGLGPNPADPLLEYPYSASFKEPLYSTDCPSFPCAVAGGGTVTFTMTVTPNECGEVDWAGTETGQWGAACGAVPFSRPYRSPRVKVRKPGALVGDASVRWAVSKTSVVEGQTVEVVATVIPAGENDQTAFTINPAIHLSSTGTAVSIVSVPSVPGTLAGCGTCVTNLCPAKAASFTWTFRADAKGWAGGKVWFTFTATGQDPYDGFVSSSWTTTGKLSILKPSVLTIGGIVPGEGTVFVDSQGSGGELSGCQVPVVMCVEVDGDTAVSTTTFLPGAGVTPTPPGRVVLSGSPELEALLTPGEHCFTWTFSPVGTGTVNFTASGVGTEVTWGTTVFVTATTAGGAFLAPAALTATAWIVDGQPPNNGIITSALGQTVDVYVRISNAGQVPLTALVASVTATGSSCGVAPVQGPWLASQSFPDIATPVAGCGDDRTFRWTFSAGGAGVVVFSITVTGTDTETSAPLVAAAFTTCLTIIPRPPLSVSLESGGSKVERGGDLAIGIRLTNDGVTTVYVSALNPVLVLSRLDVVAAAPTSALSATVPDFGSRVVYTTITAKGSAALGPVDVFLAPSPFSAFDMFAKASVPVAVSSTYFLTVEVVAPPQKPIEIPVEPGITIGDNPWRLLAGPLRIGWGEPAGGEVSLRVLTLSGETVKTLLTGPAPGVSGEILWDGANESGQRVAAGVYLLRWESAGRKQTRKLAVVK